MKLDQSKIERIEKVADHFEQKLNQPLSTEDIEVLNEELKEVLAELGHYKRFFKRLA